MDNKAFASYFHYPSRSPGGASARGRHPRGRSVLQQEQSILSSELVPVLPSRRITGLHTGCDEPALVGNHYQPGPVTHPHFSNNA